MANIFIDVETTGLDHNKHGIVQLAAIPIIDGEKKESFCSYSKPFDIPPF
jgi:DNA polymerase III epsilon subunit-like protein